MKIRELAFHFVIASMSAAMIFGVGLFISTCSIPSAQAEGVVKIGGSGGGGIVDLTNVTTIQFTPPTVPAIHNQGKIHYDDNDKTIELDTEVDGVHIQLGQELVVRCTNKTGSQLSNGQIVYINGAQGNRPTVALARADSEVTSHGYAGFVTQSSIDNNATGYVTIVGLIREVDTSAYAAGTILYLSADTAGAFTNTPPAAPNHAHSVGVVVTSSAADGVILADIKDGFELGEIHDVSTTGKANNNLLYYDSSATIWKPISLADLSAAETFVPVSSILTKGTLAAGNYTSLAAPMDSEIYQITEVAETPGIDVRLVYSGVTDLNSINLYALYSGGVTAHEVAIQVYNWTTSTWDTYGYIEVSTVYLQYPEHLLTPSNYLSNGYVWVRLLHSDVGNPSHNLYIDYASAATNIGAGSTSQFVTDAVFDDHTSNTTTAHGIDGKANLAGGNTFTGTQIFQRITTAGLYPTYLYGRPLSAKCRFNGTTTISTGVWWTVRLNDSGAAHTDDFLTHLNISSINRTLDYFRAPVTGWYYINAYYNFAANATGQRIININIDTTDPSTVYIREVKNNAGGSYETAGQTGRYLLYLNEGQKARVHHMHNAGTSIGDSYANIEISYAGP